jgi:hypothetical protein
MSSLEEILKIAGAIIVSFGGSSIILLGLSNWLGKIWADIMLEAEKKKFTMEIEEYKNKLNKEISIVNSIIEKSSYITKLQYDKEFAIYLEIWDKLSTCIISTRDLYPTFSNIPVDKMELDKFNENKLTIFVKNYNDFSNAIIKYSPFYEEKLYEGFIRLRNLCNNQGRIFKMYEFDVKYSLSFAMARDTRMSSDEHKEVYIETPEKIDNLQNSLQKEIRNYLHGLQAI